MFIDFSNGIPIVFGYTTRLMPCTETEPFTIEPLIRVKCFTVNMWIRKYKHASFGLRNIYVLFLCYLLVILNYLPKVDGGRKNKKRKSASAAAEQSEAMERLSRVFGIDHAPLHSVRATPPQFMLELFNDITDAGGLNKKDGPYKASTIVSFPDRGIYFFSFF